MKKIILTLLLLASALIFVGCTSSDEKSTGELLLSKASDTAVKELLQLEGDEENVTGDESSEELGEELGEGTSDEPTEDTGDKPTEDTGDELTEDTGDESAEEPTKTYQEAKEELDNNYTTKLDDLDTEYEEKLNALFNEEYTTNETRLEELYDLCDAKKKELHNIEEYKVISRELKSLNSKLARYDVDSDKYAEVLAKKEELLATLSEETKTLIAEKEALCDELNSLEKYFDEYWDSEEFANSYETLCDEYYEKYNAIVDEYYEAMKALKEDYFDGETEHNHGHHGWEEDDDCGKGHHGWEEHDEKDPYDWFDEFPIEDEVNNFLNALVSWDAPEGFNELSLVEKIEVMLNSEDLVLSDEVKTLLNTLLALFNAEDIPNDEIPSNNNEELSTLFGYLC